MHKCLTVLLQALKSIVAFLFVVQFVAAQSQTERTFHLGPNGNAAMSEMDLIAPLFIEDDGRRSVLTMVNSLAKSLRVHITAKAMSGEIIVSGTFTIAAREAKMLPLSALFSKGHVFGPQIGSLVLSSQGGQGFAAQLSISPRSDTSNDDVEEELLMSDDLPTATFRAVAANAKRVPKVAVYNAGMQPESAALVCYTEGAGAPEARPYSARERRNEARQRLF